MHALRLLVSSWKMIPDLFGGKTHDRCDHADKSIADVPECGLGSTPGPGVRRRDVEAVLEHVEIEST